ncbi:MAG: aldo/keto reductase family protein [Candidatus Lokiarchaeota archaeon]|nr:aldo/keto reductase family protein [Candidatus Lokiarchaeota archaeon]
MKYRKVGKSGLRISEISLGSWLTYGGSVERKQAKKCLKTALENGINFIDSAEAYAKGAAEELIGEFFTEDTYNRHEYVLSSKVFWPFNDYDVNRWGLGRKNIRNAINGTLERLHMDYIDIYFMHRYDYTTPLKETMMILDDLIHEGKIHYWGTSVWTAAQLERANAIAKEYGLHKPIVEQPMYNMFFRHIELEIMPVAITHGMGFTVWSPLGQGLLTGKYNDGTIPKGSRGENMESIQKFLKPKNIEKLQKLTEIATKNHLTLSQLALAWILRHPEISCAITGATTPQHILENVIASDVNLEPDIWKTVDTILDNEPQWPRTYEPNRYFTDKMRY